MAPFVDTNIPLDLISPDAAKPQRAQAMLAGGVVTRVQVLNAFANVARHKHSLDWQALQQVLGGIAVLCDVRHLRLASHQQGLALVSSSQRNVCDAMVAAAALDAGCDTLMREDF